jgi:L-histidine N-alpha-methyltransferase
MDQKEMDEHNYKAVKLTHNFETTFAKDVFQGLSAPKKYIPPVYFYDDTGSELFEKICQQSEYYLTRTEAEILENHSSELATLFSKHTSLIELGSGSAQKTRYLIEAFLTYYGKVEYFPIDVSESILLKSSTQLKESYPSIKIKPVVALYKDGISQINTHTVNPKLVIWLGSSIGNFETEKAVKLLKKIGQNLSDADRILIGMDLRKDREILEKAYNDSAGITANFNLNLLSRINNELCGNFSLKNFKHIALFNDVAGRIEMYLESLNQQNVKIVDLDLEVNFNKNERIHTENSYKYTLEEINYLSNSAGLKLYRQWFDSNQWFSLNLLGWEE